MNRAEKIEEIRESYLKKERKILKPILQLLKKLKIGPDGLSYSAAITTALFFISVIFGYFSIATILILIYVLLDKLDGALARYLEEDSQSGILTDFITNITSTLLITLSFEVLGLISWVHVVLFVYLYAIIYGFRLVKERTNKTITFWIVGLRTLLVVGYLTILVTNINLIDELFVILIITLISAIIYYFIRFKINLTKTTKFLKKPFQSIIIQVKKPNELETKKELIKKITPRNLLLSPIYTAICHSDVRYYEGDNPPEKLKGKYPLIMFHEGIAKIKEVGKGILSYEKGQKVVVIPNIPCYVHDKRKYSKRKYACECCRNESIGENYCTDVRFMSSNSPGINRTIFEHPTECVVPIPKGVSDKSALMTELLTVNYRAIQEAKIGNKDKIAIIGSGPTGYLMAVLISKYLKIPKQRILITNITDQKLKLSKTIAKTVNTKNGLSLEFENKYDVVFECVGGANTETTIEQAIKLVRPKGTIVLLGVANKKIPINTRQVLDKGIKLIGTSRSGIQDYKDIMVILKNKKLQKYVEKIIYKTEYDGTKITEMKLALSKAKDRNVYGKILIKYD